MYSPQTALLQRRPLPVFPGRAAYAGYSKFGTYLVNICVPVSAKPKEAKSKASSWPSLFHGCCVSITTVRSGPTRERQGAADT
jgi:hypothetical protein